MMVREIDCDELVWTPLMDRSTIDTDFGAFDEEYLVYATIWSWYIYETRAAQLCFGVFKLRDTH